MPGYQIFFRTIYCISLFTTLAQARDFFSESPGIFGVPSVKRAARKSIIPVVDKIEEMINLIPMAAHELWHTPSDESLFPQNFNQDWGCEDNCLAEPVAFEESNLIYHSSSADSPELSLVEIINQAYDAGAMRQYQIMLALASDNEKDEVLTKNRSKQDPVSLFERASFLVNQAAKDNRRKRYLSALSYYALALNHLAHDVISIFPEKSNESVAALKQICNHFVTFYGKKFSKITYKASEIEKAWTLALSMSNITKKELYDPRWILRYVLQSNLFQGARSLDPINIQEKLCAPVTRHTSQECALVKEHWTDLSKGNLFTVD